MTTNTTTARYARKTLSFRGKTIIASMDRAGLWSAREVLDFESHDYAIEKQASGWWKVMGIGDIACSAKTLEKAMELLAIHYINKEGMARRAAESAARRERLDAAKAEGFIRNAPEQSAPAPKPARPMTLHTVIRVNSIVEAAQQGQRVAWALEGGRSLYGTARSLGDEYGYFQKGTEDVRDLFLRITTETGLERYELVSDLLEELGVTFFVNVRP